MKTKQMVVVLTVIILLFSVLFTIRGYNRQKAVGSEARFEAQAAKRKADFTLLRERRAHCSTGTMVELDDLPPKLYVVHDYPVAMEDSPPNLAGELFVDDLDDANTILYVLSATERAVGYYSKTGSQAYGFGFDLCLVAKDHPAVYRFHFGAAPPKSVSVSGPGRIRSVELVYSYLPKWLGWKLGITGEPAANGRIFFAEWQPEREEAVYSIEATQK